MIAVLFALFYVANSLRCFNFYGLETERAQPVCNWVNPPEYYLDILKTKMSVNAVRIPFSGEYVKKSNFEQMDHLIREARMREMYVILDYHRITSYEQAYSPITGQTFGEYIDTWVNILKRYHDIIWGVDLFNEYQGKDQQLNVNLMGATIYALEAHFPNSNFTYIAGAAFWNQDARGMEQLLDIVPGRVKIGIHSYPFCCSPEYINDNLPSTIPGSSYFVGEIGWNHNELDWIVSAHHIFQIKGVQSYCGWTIAHSQLSGTWWDDDCITINLDKVDSYNNLFLDKL